MASRRTRIKGIANIPQRRKAGTSSLENNKVIKEEKIDDEPDNLLEDVKKETVPESKFKSEQTESILKTEENARLKYSQNNEEIKYVNVTNEDSLVDKKEGYGVSSENLKIEENRRLEGPLDNDEINLVNFTNEDSLVDKKEGNVVNSEYLKIEENRRLGRRLDNDEISLVNPTNEDSLVDRKEGNVVSLKIEENGGLEGCFNNDEIKSVNEWSPADRKEEGSPEKLKEEQLILNDVSKENSETIKGNNTSQQKRNADKPNVPTRRKFLKPNISSVVLTRKPREQDKKIVVLDQIVIPPHTNKEIHVNPVSNSDPKLSVHTLPVAVAGAEYTLNETSFSVPRETPSPVKNKTFVELVGHNSDTEYPPPPPSPSKINRSRIKAIPRLSQRKTSFSASESEDESRRHGRIRNDSVCSVASNIQDPPPSLSDCMSPQKLPTVQSWTPKRLNRSEQSRKIAEARREFQRKFDVKNPDKSKLRMIDLLFYNPKSNPMNKNKDKDKNTENEVESENKEETVEEAVDEPAEKPKELKEDEKKDSDEENEMPVPQIKIGPSGEIILDEQSLVVESQEVKKQKEQIQKSALVNGDFDTGYGIYKKVKRSKEWSERETLRFYKALQVFGTDFSLMAELFPNRNRRELKMKFKKEERLNRMLIDKAIMQPCQYNYNELKREVEQEEREFEELKKINMDIAKTAKEKQVKENMRKRKAREEARRKENEEYLSKPPKISKTKKKPLTINSILEDSDADVSDMDTQSDSEEEITILKPTRSGRIPKATQKYDETLDDILPNNLIYTAPLNARILESARNFYSGANGNDMIPIKKALRRASIASNHEQAQNLEPGSVVILSEENETGQQVPKIYMVTPEKKLTPLDVDPETVSEALRAKVAENMAAALIAEENVTISEDETETLRSNITSENKNKSIVPENEATSDCLIINEILSETDTKLVDSENKTLALNKVSDNVFTEL